MAHPRVAVPRVQEDTERVKYQRIFCNETSKLYQWERGVLEQPGNPIQRASAMCAWAMPSCQLFSERATILSYLILNAAAAYDNTTI